MSTGTTLQMKGKMHMYMYIYKHICTCIYVSGTTLQRGGEICM